jgi:hypothetical protein
MSEGAKPSESGKPVLAVLKDGAPLPDDEARTLWTAFSAHMDAHRGDMAGFAKQQGWHSVAPEYRKGQAVLIASTTAEAAAAAQAAAAKAAPKPKAPPQAAGKPAQKKPAQNAQKKPAHAGAAKPAHGKPAQGKPAGKGQKPGGKR